MNDMNIIIVFCHLCFPLFRDFSLLFHRYYFTQKLVLNSKTSHNLTTDWFPRVFLMLMLQLLINDR